MEHEVRIIDQKTIIVDAVSSVDSFDDTCILLKLEEVDLLIYGSNLHMDGLDPEEGRFYGAGEIESITYTKTRKKPKLLGRLHK